MKKLHWVQWECDCGFTTSKWRDDVAGNLSAENELADHMKQSKKCQHQIYEYTTTKERLKIV